MLRSLHNPRSGRNCFCDPAFGQVNLVSIFRRNYPEKNGHRSVHNVTSQQIRRPQINANRAVYPSPSCSTFRRCFRSGQSLRYKSVQEARSRYISGPFSIIAGVLFISTGIGLMAYFRHVKTKLERKRLAENTKGVGRPLVGGPFELVDQNGKKFSSEDMKGKYALVYFGFTHCPDICPEELDKMAAMMDLVHKSCGNTMRSIFISCDPARDTPAVVGSYLKDFHPDMIGLTGTWEEIKAICKAYRVYFSTPPDVKPGQDYLVDHSIYFYIMDPDGDFVEAVGRQHTAEQGAKLIIDHIKNWTGTLDRS